MRWTSRLAAAAVATAGVIAWTASPAAAGVAVSVTPSFPSSFIVGQTGLPASIMVTNGSTPPQNVGNLNVTDLRLVPSCANFNVHCAGGGDPGVFALSPVGTGEALTACAGIVFNINLVTPAVDEYQFVPAGGYPIVLGPPASSCTVDFTLSVLKPPTIDSQPGSPGIQTNQLAFASATHPATGASSPVNTGASIATVNLATPTLVTTASGPPPAVPGTVSDTATLSFGFSPTGTITFRLYGPNDPNCANSPAFTSAGIPVAGNGTYNSGNATVTAPGAYRWTASYSGDANNAPASSPCGAANESVTVTDKLVRAVDFDGDGKADVAVYRPSTGEWFILNSATGTSTVVVWGVSTDQPVPGYYDSDTKADIAVYRPSTGEWFIRNSTTGAGTVLVWGVSTDQPVPGNYDGDTMADVAVYRPSTGQWFIRNSSTGAGTVLVWGVSTDQPVPANYDGDTKTDVAVYRPSTGEWFIRNSSTGAGTVVVWGVSTDQPVPGNYDGDTMADVAVYRPSTGFWYLRQSTAGTATVLWGVPGDRPVGN